MKIVDKIIEKQKDLYARKPITIAFLGDSVTQGCFECFEPVPGGIETDFIPKFAYCEKVKSILNLLYPSVPITIINAGISGGSAHTGLKRIDRDVLSYNPDLVVVCFGLNDCGGGEKDLPDFKSYLNDIFGKIKDNGAECIYLSPNTMNYNVSPKLSSDFFKKLADDFAGRMKDGILDRYIETAVNTAIENGVTVCDCYSIWKSMVKCGVNVTDLLANKLNHPVKDMHWLFAFELVKTMLEK